MTIPYVPGLSEKVRRVARKYKICTAFKTRNTIRQHLVQTKPKNGTQDTKNCIYSIKCECNRQYIGETKRPLNIRIKEHKNNVRLGLVDKSKIAEHIWSENHKFNWEEAKIIHRESNLYKRKIIEASYIKLTDNPISQSSIEVRPLWLPLLKKELKFDYNIPITNKQAEILPVESPRGVVTRSRARKLTNNRPLP